MICLNCKKQIADDLDRCPNCGTEVFHKQQLAREISFRRYQRWVFYGFFILIFIGMIGIVVKIYNVNNDLLLKMSGVQKDLNSKSAEAATAKEDLNKKTEELNNVKTALEEEKAKLTGELTAREQILSDKLGELQKTVEEKLKLSDDYGKLVSSLKGLSGSAAGISEEDLKKIRVADYAYAGMDADGDGLPDEMEAALGTSATSTDTDGDNYGDKMEIVGGFDPLAVNGKLPLDQAFADKQRGRIFKQAWGGGYLWYVGVDGKRYFLGIFQ